MILWRKADAMPLERNVTTVKYLLVTLLWLVYTLAAWTASAGDNLSDTYKARLLGKVQDRGLREASGLAQSTREQNILWSHNDSGLGPYLFAMTPEGKSLARFIVENGTARDWEDIAAFSWQSNSWLAIADTGDNASVKPVSSIHILEEPEILQTRPRPAQRIKVKWSLMFRFPEGPADCEAIAVDPKEERIYLLTKRQNPPRLYSLPLQADFTTAAVLDAKLEGQVSSIPKPTAREILEHPATGLHRSQPTAMDFASDGSFAVVGTYGYAWRFTRSPDQQWITAMNSSPLRINVPAMQQSEAVAIAPGNRGLYFTSEGVNPPIYLLTQAEPAELPPAR